MNKLEKKLLKKRYLNEQKERIEKDGFIFDAVGGGGDEGGNLSEKETCPYMYEAKVVIQKDGFIFDAIAGFGDWADDLSEKELDSYLCDASSPADIKRWFNEIIYPGTTQLPGSSKEKLIEFLDLYNENKINQIIAGMYSSMANCTIGNLDENQDVFFQTLAQLVSEKLDDMI